MSWMSLTLTLITLSLVCELMSIWKGWIVSSKIYVYEVSTISPKQCQEPLRTMEKIGPPTAAKALSTKERRADDISCVNTVVRCLESDWCDWCDWCDSWVTHDTTWHKMARNDKVAWWHLYTNIHCILSWTKLSKTVCFVGWNRAERSKEKWLTWVLHNSGRQTKCRTRSDE